MNEWMNNLRLKCEIGVTKFPRHHHINYQFPKSTPLAKIPERTKYDVIFMWRLLPPTVSTISRPLIRLAEPDVCWGPRSLGIILEEAAVIPVPSVIGWVIWVNGWCPLIASAFGQWWYITPMCSVSYSLLMPKVRTTCVIEVIFFFSLLRMTVRPTLFQEYCIKNNNTWFHIK